ncbi:MAG: alpha/beta hydrolase [Spirochaetota bacterium]
MSNFSHEEGKITGKNEIELYYQSWISPREKGLLVVVHGLGEHGGRYGNLVSQLNGKGVSIYAMDLRGHGKSGGKRGHVDSFLDYIHDLKAFVEHIKEKHPESPIFMFGHSMGANVATRYALTYQEDLSGLILSANALKPLIEKPAIVQGFASFLSSVIPTLQQPNGINPELLSHDEEVVALYRQDELVHDKVTLRWFTEFYNNAENCIDRAIEIRLPILLMHGSDDQVAHPDASELLYEKVSSTDKEIKIFDALYHEIINEIGKDRSKVLTLISKWLTARVTKAKQSMKKTAKKTTNKKTASKKTAEKKSNAKKVTAKKSSAKKGTAKKSSAKKSSAKKASAKKSTAKKSSTKKSTAKKGAAKKTTKKTNK